MNGVPSHGYWPVHAVQLEVEAAGVAHHVPVCIAAPDGGGLCAAVGTAKVNALGKTRLQHMIKSATNLTTY